MITLRDKPPNLLVRPLLILLLIPFSMGAQSYVDLARIGYNQTFNNDFEGTASSTQVSSFQADLTLPLVLNERHTFVSGLLFSRNELQLFPDAPFTALYSTALKLGVSTRWNDKWSSTVVLLPKLASDYGPVSSDDFFFGGYATVKLTKHPRLVYRFGLYGSTEAFGVFTTPFAGWYYLSPNGRFEMDCSLPISVDLNYCLGTTTVGLDYFGIGRSFNLSDTTPNRPQPSYVDFTSLEFSTYLQFNALQRTVLLRAKIGYASNDYDVYAQDETIDLGVSAFSFGDDRNQLNPAIGGGFFAKLEAIYRFKLPNQDTQGKTKNEDGTPMSRMRR